MTKQALSSRNWAGKASAGLILGFALALGAAGLFRIATGATDAFFSTRGQIGMWLMAPVWALTMSFCFLFRSGLWAWGWLLAANIVVWALLLAIGGMAA